MAATFEWDEANGVGETVSHAVGSINWKSADTSTGGTDYQSNPITAGTNSYEKWQYGHFTGTYNEISAGLFAHTANAFNGTSLILKGQPAMTVDADRLAYTTPSQTANALLTFDQSGVTAIGSGRDVFFGITGPAAAGKAATTTAAPPVYTNYLTSQLQTTGAAPAGDTVTATLTLQYDEN